MQRALDLVRDENCPVSRAAKICGVPRVTLIDNLKGTHKTGAPGRPIVLSEEEERALVEVLVQMSEFNYPVTKRHVCDMVKNYLDKNRVTRFKGNRPGRIWARNFLERHKDRIAVKKPTNIRRSRAAVSPDDIKAYHANLSKELEGIPPSNIFNCDESCLQDNPSAHKAFFSKGVRYPEQVRIQLPVLLWYY
jgi:hypothetical protein